MRSGKPRLSGAGLCAIAIALISGCVLATPRASAVECGPLPDAGALLAQAWQAYQPDQPLSPAVNLRRRLFALQTLLISAGMYNEPPADPAAVAPAYAQQFVRDFGATRNPRLSTALARLNTALRRARDRSEADLVNNCGLILARRALRDDPVGVSTDWVVQTVTLGFAPYFQASIRQMVHEAAQACVAQPEIASHAEDVLTCTMQRIGLETDETTPER
jgi:hypothetical protein